MNDETATRAKRRWPRIVLLLGLALLVLAVLLLDTAPAVPEQPRPTAADIAAAQDAYAELTSEEVVTARFDGRTLTGLSALVRDALALERLRMEVEDSVLVGEASLALPLGLWLNASGRVAGEQNGFPRLACRVGAVAPPAWLCRQLVELGRRALRRGGSDLAPLDRLVLYSRVDPASVLLVVRPPSESGLVNNLVDTRRLEVDYDEVTAIHCRLVAAEKRRPAEHFAVLLRRTFADVDPADTRAVRAGFIGLAQFVIGAKARRLTPREVDPAQACKRTAPEVLLQGREDLAKHWAFSAGLTAAFGSEAATSMGEWKELSDSLPKGSGFSFVDLAADRSGVRFARRALEEGDARAVVAELRRATDAALLPERLLDGPEGLRDSEFARRYRSLDAQAYSAAIAVIDRELAREEPSGAK